MDSNADKSILANYQKTQRHSDARNIQRRYRKVPKGINAAAAPDFLAGQKETTQ